MPRCRPFPVIRALVLPLALLAAGSGAAAQEPDVFDLFKPQLRIGLESSGERGVRDVDPNTGRVSGSDTFRWAAASLNFNLPLGGARLHPGGALRGHQFFGHALSSGSRARMSFLRDPDLDVFAGGLGFSALMLTPGRRLAAVALFATVAEEEETLDDPDVRTTGLAVGSFTTRSAFWIYGGGFTYHLGRPLPFPIFGGWGRVSPNWSLGGLIPAYFQARYQPEPTWNLDLFVKVQGNQYGYDNRPDAGIRDFPGRDGRLRVRIVQGRLGAAVGWSFSRNTSLVAEAGSLVGRRVAFVEERDTFLRVDFEPAGYARIFLRLAFGESLLDPEKP